MFSKLFLFHEDFPPGLKWTRLGFELQLLYLEILVSPEVGIVINTSEEEDSGQNDEDEKVKSGGDNKNNCQSCFRVK